MQVQLGGQEGRHLVRLKGDRAHPSSRGYACEKAHQLDHYQHSSDRITQPLRRRADGGFDVIDWDTAIREVAARLGAVRDKFGGEAIFYYGGGGQGNHLPGAYSSATRRALGSRYRSSALAQEKTGEFWVSQRMLGTYTRGDFEHCEVGIFLGKNPWHSHSIARARVTLKAIAKDPKRTLIVIDPRRTETAALADIHLQVRPGHDVYLVAALAGILVQERLLDEAFLSKHATGLSAVTEALSAVPVSEYCERAGVAEALVRTTAQRIAVAESVASFEDLGVQMNRHSTLVSYLHRMLWLLTGNFGKQGSQYVPTTLVNIAAGSTGRKSPVVGANIISGLVPCNVIAEEILTDHEKRYRAMIVEAANPAHSLADSQRMREALRSLDTLVVIDVAMSETAQLADYVLPASTQFEKAEATFFNFEFPQNYFHLRPRLMPPPPGPLSEAEIHARLTEALGVLTPEDLAPLSEAAAGGLKHYAETLMARVLPDPRLAPLAPVILYRTLGPTLPEELREGAVVFGLALKAAMENGPSLARAGFDGTPLEAAEKLFQALLDQPSGVVFAVDAWPKVEDWIATEDGKIQLEIPELLSALREIATEATPTDPEFPLVLSAGERRSFTANTIMRDPAWRQKDVSGALRMSPSDAASLGVSSGESVQLSTKRASTVVTVEVTDSMQSGHISLPNGLGLSYPRGDGRHTTGVAPNELTASEDRDPIAGTPWHKHVPARVDRVEP